MLIKYLPTNNVFDLPEAEVKRILLNDRGNDYKVIEDNKAAKEVKKEVESILEEDVVDKDSIYNQIVEGVSLTDKLQDKTKDELKHILDELGIKYTISNNKLELIEKLELANNDIDISRYL